MERVHYRRVADRSVRPQEREDSDGGFKDSVIIQAIVAAFIMVAVMGICMLDYGFTASARDGLRQALDGETTPDGLFSKIERISGGLFGTEPANPDTDGAPAQSTSGQSYGSEPAVPVFNSQTLTTNGDESKIPVPELSAYPEP